MSAHAQYRLCTGSVKGFPSLVYLHILSIGPSLINMQGKYGCILDKTIISRVKVVLQQKTDNHPKRNCVTAPKNRITAPKNCVTATICDG